MHFEVLVEDKSGIVGGAQKLKNQPWYVIGKEKSKWAKDITPYINIDKNKSPSFCYFRDKIRELI